MSRSPWRLLTIGVALVGAPGCSDPALVDVQAQVEPQLTLEGTSVRRRLHAIPESDRVMRQGMRVANGACAYADTLRPQPDGDPVISSVAEVDFETCRVILARHEFHAFKAWYERTVGPLRIGRRLPGQEALAAPSATSGSGDIQTTTIEWYQASGSPTALGAAAAQEECTEAVGSFSDAWQDIWTIDPVFIEVGRSEHRVDWQWHQGLCANWMRSYLYSDPYEPSGWEVQSHYHPKPYPGPGWDVLRARPIQTFRNTTFADTYCPVISPGNTYQEYRNYIDGWEDGYPTMLPGGVAYGGCAFLLTTLHASGFNRF